MKFPGSRLLPAIDLRMYVRVGGCQGRLGPRDTDPSASLAIVSP